MKLRFTQLGVLCFLCVLLSGCFEKEEENKPNNYVEYQGESYSMATGTLAKIEIGDGRYSYSIGLSSVGATNYSADMEIASLSLAIASDSPDLASGTYYYQEDLDADGVVLAGFTFGQTFEDPFSATQLILMGGSVTVNKAGNSYALKIAMEDENGEPVTGYFSGPLLTQDGF